MKPKLFKVNNIQKNESKSINTQVSDLLYKTLISRSEEINFQNSRFMEGLKSWHKGQLKRYKHNLLESGKGWNPEVDILLFNKSLLISLEEIFNGIRGKNFKSPDGIRKKIDIDGSASNFLIQKYLNPITDKNNKSIEKINGIKISLIEKKDFINTKVIIDNVKYEVSNYTFLVYCFLKIIGLVPSKGKAQLKNFVDFINIIDYIPYEEAEQLYLNSYKTLLGIVSFMNIKSIFNYFGFNDSGMKNFDEKLMKYEVMDTFGRKTTIGELSNKRQKLIEISLNKYEIAQKNGLIVNGHKSKYLIDLGTNIPNGPELVSYKKIGLFKIFPSGDVYINNPYGLEEYFFQLGNVVKGKLYFLKNTDPEYKTKIILLLNRLNFDENTKNLIINYIKKTTKQEIKPTNVNEEKLKIIIDELKIENDKLIEKIENIQEDVNFPDLDKCTICKGLVISILKYGVIIDIGGLKGLLHKTNTSVPSIKDYFKVGDILEVGISKVIIQDGEKKISFY
ncbi:MAG: S1 RNA-binding domain-containing protein [Candidatus Absconditabacteria bacterium]